MAAHREGQRRKPAALGGGVATLGEAVHLHLVPADDQDAAERLIDQDPSLAAHPQVLAALREQAPRDLTWIHRS